MQNIDFEVTATGKPIFPAQNKKSSPFTNSKQRLHLIPELCNECLVILGLPNEKWVS